MSYKKLFEVNHFKNKQKDLECTVTSTVASWKQQEEYNS